MSVCKQIKPKPNKVWEHAGFYNVPCKYCHSPDDVIAYGHQQVINDGKIVKKERWLCNKCHKTFTNKKKKTG